MSTHTSVGALLTAARSAVAMTYDEARAAADRGVSLLYCDTDVLNPCWSLGTAWTGHHWGGGLACRACTLRAAVWGAQ